jgi:hypothetical protein
MGANPPAFSLWRANAAASGAPAVRLVPDYRSGMITPQSGPVARTARSVGGAGQVAREAPFRRLA